jgi:hypothetical protein
MIKLQTPDFRISHRKNLLWLLAFLITIFSAVYQRVTGPTYPVSGKISLDGNSIDYQLLRTETTDKDAEIDIEIPDTTIAGFLKFRRYKSSDKWTVQPMRRVGSKLAAFLPKQPPAGKIMYFVYLSDGHQTLSLSGEEPVVLRYKGPVPAFILIPHILFMFIAMMLSNRTGLEALDRKGNTRPYMYWTIGLLFVGGLILGPLVQKFAFGALWTGVPFGYDLTDNKTLIALLGWVIAWAANMKTHSSRGWIIFASLLTLLMYIIPHSVLGSELDYRDMPSDAAFK